MIKKNIAIIGGGVSCVAFVRCFTQSAIAAGLKDLRITIFEPSRHFGTGLAFQPDSPILIEHGGIHISSINPQDINEFSEWLRQQPALHDEIIVEGLDSSAGRNFIPRQVFGRYVKDKFDEAVSHAARNGAEVRIVRDSVARINDGPVQAIETSSGRTYESDFTILCTGHNQPEDLYGLKGTPAYINNPYPVSKKLAGIPSDKRVAIIGNSLTAVDAAVALKAAGHVGNVTMLTRSHVRLKCRGVINLRQLQYLDRDLINDIASRKGTFTVRDALRLLRSELRNSRCDWRTLFRNDNERVSLVQHLENEISIAKTEREWQSIFFSMRPAVEVCWRHFDAASRKIMFDRFNRTWTNIRSPIPVQNAAILLEMASRNQLDMIPDITHIGYCETTAGYVAETRSGEKQAFDMVINATGSSRSIGADDSLMFRLLEDGLVRRHPFGGVDVDFDSSSVIGPDRVPNPRLRVIGHNTQGVYFYASSLGVVSSNCKRVAENLTAYLLDESARAPMSDRGRTAHEVANGSHC